MEFIASEVYANDPVEIGFPTTRYERFKAPGAEENNSKIHVKLPKSLEFHCFHVEPDQGVFGGRHDGTILHWPLQCTQTLPPPKSRYLEKHKGPVLALAFCPALGSNGVLCSGSADRQIKFWDTKSTNTTPHIQQDKITCLLSISAHDGSIFDLKFMYGDVLRLLSCSLDETINIWSPVEYKGDVEGLQFVLLQTIKMDKNTCATSICVRDGAFGSIFIGNTCGGISQYSMDSSIIEVNYNHSSSIQTDIATFPDIKHPQNDQDLGFVTDLPQFHTLGIIQMLLSSDNSFLISIGYDQKAQIIDLSAKALFFSITNPNSVHFTSISWDESKDILILVDALGWLYLWNVYTDKIVKKENMCGNDSCEILFVKLIKHPSLLFIGIKDCIRQWGVNRNVDFIENVENVASIISIDLFQNSMKQSICSDVSFNNTTARDILTTQIVSVSVDNIIRSWDSYDVSMNFSFEENEADITCLVLSLKYDKIYTGHENGALKSWGIYTRDTMITFIPTKSAISCIAVVNVGSLEYLLTGSLDNYVTISEVQSDSIVHLTNLTSKACNSLVDEVSSILFHRGKFIAPYGREFFVTGHQYGSIVMWGWRQRQQLCCISSGKYQVSCLASHGCFLFSGSSNGVISIWNLCNLTDPYKVCELRHPEHGIPTSPRHSASLDSVVNIEVIRKSGHIVAGYSDGDILVWDYAAFEDDLSLHSYGKVLHRIRQCQRMKCLRYWEACHIVVCGTTGGKLRIFNL